MKISKNYSTEDWIKLKFDNEQDWEEACKIFYDRLYSRFLKPIEMIEGYEFSGFVIMALDCLLIETYQQFYKGKKETPKRESKEYFTQFFNNTNFKEDFDDEKAEMFYKQIRCGILHQAETKESSKIKISHELPIVKFTKEKDGLIINRKKFHKKLISIIDSYIEDLKNPSNEDLRKNFRKKMNYICRINSNE